ncbi:hypothetical protein [Sphingomonas bacterium]|uniref:hypothetical protein n=1 Tax=Sphingomonas bacterium TaxID=1895847 RepID=UPI001577120D|nr:hypothetical protein [Sphingomonas bacterium]
MIRTLMLASTILAAAPASTQALPAANPFARASTLPYQAPPFDRITDADYKPAIEAGMADSLAAVRTIADDPAASTFDNVIVAMERQGRLLARAQAAFGQVTQANTNPTLGYQTPAEIFHPLHFECESTGVASAWPTLRKNPGSMPG